MSRHLQSVTETLKKVQEFEKGFSNKMTCYGKLAYNFLTSLYCGLNYRIIVQIYQELYNFLRIDAFIPRTHNF